MATGKWAGQEAEIDRYLSGLDGNDKQAFQKRWKYRSITPIDHLAITCTAIGGGVERESTAMIISSRQFTMSNTIACSHWKAQNCRTKSLGCSNNSSDCDSVYVSFLTDRCGRQGNASWRCVPTIRGVWRGCDRTLSHGLPSLLHPNNFSQHSTGLYLESKQLLIFYFILSLL